jgi:F0F1-type ATP synthase assembly protein I
VFWPLIGGFVAFVLVAVLLGWILDPSRHRGADGEHH